MRLTPLGSLDEAGSADGATAGGVRSFPTALFTITGDPGAVEGSASSYGRFATNASEIGAGVAGRTADSWTGSEGDLYRSRVAEYPPMMSAAASVFAAIATQLQAFAQELGMQQRAMDALRAHALEVWRQLQQAKSSLQTAQAALETVQATAPGMVAAGAAPQAQAGLTAAQGAVTAAAAQLTALTAEWEACCAKARAIQAAMKEAAAAAASRIGALQDPPAPPTPASGGATAGSASGPTIQWGGLGAPAPQAAPLPSLGDTDQAAITPKNAALFLKNALAVPLGVNSVYSLYAAIPELYNSLVDFGRTPLPKWFMPGLDRKKKIPTIVSVYQNSKDTVTAATDRLGSLAKSREELELKVARNQKRFILNPRRLLTAPFLKFARWLNGRETQATIRTLAHAEKVRKWTRGPALAARTLGPLDSAISLLTTEGDGLAPNADRTAAALNLAGAAVSEGEPLVKSSGKRLAQGFVARVPKGKVVNAALTGVTRLAPLASKAAPWLIKGVPVVGQAASVYQTGRWLYDNYDPARKSFDAVFDFAKDGTKALAHGDLDALGREAGEMGGTLAGQAKQVFTDVKNVTETAVNLGRDARNAIAGIFHPNG